MPLGVTISPLLPLYDLPYRWCWSEVLRFFGSQVLRSRWLGWVILRRPLGVWYMLGEKSLNKYARAVEIFCEPSLLAPLFTTARLRLKSQSFTRTRHQPTAHSRSLLSSHTIYAVAWDFHGCWKSLLYTFSSLKPLLPGWKERPWRGPYYIMSLIRPLIVLFTLIVKHVSNGILLINLVSLEDLNLTLFLTLLTVRWYRCFFFI
jgi:hypothetical protein